MIMLDPINDLPRVSNVCIGDRWEFCEPGSCHILFGIDNERSLEWKNYSGQTLRAALVFVQAVTLEDVPISTSRPTA